MIRYKCVVSYCGANYDGWQTQKTGKSIQEQLEAAIEVITQTRTIVTGSGRTDAGVNANGQVFHFDAKVDMPERKWMGALNRFLPDDIHIRSMERVDELFHARFCVKAKQYAYRINLGEYDVFSKDHVYQCPYPLNIEKMKEASRYLIGTHDFTSYNATTLKEIEDQVRTVYSIDFTVENNILTILYRGKGFLRYMVRMMSAQLIEVGRGKLEPIQVKEILEARSKTAGRKNAPAQGLTLETVEYFKVLAMDDEYMIREAIETDGVEDMNEYVFVHRHSQTLYGLLTVKNSGATLVLNDEKLRENALKLVPQAEDALAEIMGENGLRIEVAETSKKPEK